MRQPTTVPLNSRRLTVPLLRQLAGWLGVPSTAKQGDLGPMIEAKLVEDGRDLLLMETEQGTCVSLQDESGMFWEFDTPAL